MTPWIRRLPVVGPGTRSLRRQLLIWLLLPQLVLWCAAAWVTYDLAARYANAAIDRSLYQTSRALARQVKPVDNGLLIDFPRAARDIIETDPDDRVYYMVSTPPGQFILGNHKLPPPPAGLGQLLDRPEFYDGAVADAQDPDGAGTRVRVAALYLAYGDAEAPQRMLVQVAKSRASREELARRILVDTALPLSALMIAMSVIVWAGIRAGLAPLAKLRDAVQDRAPNDLAPIRIESAPEEVRALAKALNTLLAEVQENVASQRRFISDAAHQLRTPLAGLKSQTEIALKDAADTALRPRLERVHESATRSARLVGQLLTLARAEPESRGAMGRTRFDLRRLVQGATIDAVPRALQAGIDLGAEDVAEAPAADGGSTPTEAPTDRGDAPVWIDGNALLVGEAIANVIDNAIRYAGRGAEVTVSLATEGRQARVVVADTGPGVPAEHRAAVFERFFRLAHDGNGCGLGLAIVKEIVERHSGSVELRAAQPHGLVVVIRLPIAAGAPAPPAAAAGATLPPATAGMGHRTPSA